MLDHAWIASHIPHQGSMCVLHLVSHWDEQAVVCIATSHRKADNPLRSHNQLGAACGIEYAAQAMAVHGALIVQNPTENKTNNAITHEMAGDQDRPRTGFLVSVRGTTLHVARLDNIEADLVIEARCINASGGHILYQFSIHADDQLVIEGRAAVVVNADNIMLTSSPLPISFSGKKTGSAI